MARLRFGTFLAPHHPLGESPTTQFQRDLDFAEHLDRWGFDEFWCGEHHSSGEHLPGTQHVYSFFKRAIGINGCHMTR